MPRSRPSLSTSAGTPVKVENSFIKGLITEATALQFPENAATDTFDCVFDRTGRVTRRFGLDFEENYVSRATTSSGDEAYSAYLWEAVAGVEINITVVQKGSNLYLYNVSSTTDVSAGYFSTVYLGSFLPGGSALEYWKSPCQFTTGGGVLFVVNSALEPFYISVDPNTLAVTTTQINLRERDLTGIADGLAVAERPTSTLANLIATNPQHWYNILNQGWSSGGAGGGGAGGGPASDSGGTGTAGAVTQWDAARTDLPSNADVVSLYRLDETDIFDPNKVLAKDAGSYSAPKGHFVLNPFVPDRQAAMANDGFGGVIAIPFIAFNRPSCIAFYSGRVFYSGISYPGLSTKIFFTQIAIRADQYGKCYQVNDPTSEFFFDLLPSDGGVINIPESGKIIKLFPMRTALIVIAVNGIWVVQGSAGQPFRATDYQVKKISSLGSVAAMSVVDFRGNPIWWGLEGIYGIKYDPNYDAYTVDILTVTTINSFFLDIPLENRGYVKGIYNPEDFTVFWLYNDNKSFPVEDRYKYNKVLCWSGVTQAFFPWTISALGTVTIRDLVFVQAGNRTDVPTNKYVTVFQDGSNENLTISEFFTERRVDWPTYSSLIGSSEVNFNSYFITGYRFPGQAMYQAQSNYVIVYAEQNNLPDVSDSCFVQGVFDFATSGNSGKYGSRQDVYTSFHEDRSLSYRRLKIRGKGRSLQLKFSSNEDSPFTIIGWSQWGTTNASV